MEMQQVRYFVAMAEALNFTRAAEMCDVSQPSLTRGIQKLEAELGGPLFRRERGNTRLTKLGRMMLPHLERTLSAAEAARALARDITRQDVTPLTVGVETALDSGTLDALIAEIGAHLPGFSLAIESGTAEALLERAAAGDLDLVLLELPDSAPERLESWPLFEQLYGMVTRRTHRLATAGEVSLEDVRDEPWIECGPDLRRIFDELAGRRGVTPHFAHRAGDRIQVRRMIAAGLGSAFLPPMDDSNLAMVRLADVEFSRPVVLATIAGCSRSVAADAFVRAARSRDWQDAGSAQRT